MVSRRSFRDARFETLAGARSSTQGWRSLLNARLALAPQRKAGARSSTTDKSFDWAHRRGLAFAELLEHLPTDDLHPKTAATIVVTLDHDVLQGALKVAGLDTGGTITAGEARRLACGAGLIPAVLGTRSVALDLGRETRLFTEAQRIAAGLHHDSCAADGCDRPYAWCELHHHKPWAQAGRTERRASSTHPPARPLRMTQALSGRRGPCCPATGCGAPARHRSVRSTSYD